MIFKPGFLINALCGISSLKEIRDMLLLAHNDNLISEEEFFCMIKQVKEP